MDDFKHEVIHFLGCWWRCVWILVLAVYVLFEAYEEVVEVGDKLLVVVVFEGMSLVAHDYRYVLGLQGGVLGPCRRYLYPRAGVMPVGGRKLLYKAYFRSRV